MRRQSCGPRRCGDDALLQLAIESLRLLDVSLKTIGFGNGCDAAKLKRIAGMVGERGEYVVAVDAVQLVESFEAAAAELSHNGGSS